MQLNYLQGWDEQAITNTLRRDGGVVVEQFLAPEALEALRSDMNRELQGVDWCNMEGDGGHLAESFFGLTTKRLHGLAGRSPLAAKVMADPRLLSLAQSFLGDPVIYSTAELMAIGPGEQRQRLHRDANSWHRAPVESEFLVSINLALTDFRQENGATVIVPGSQGWAPDRTPQDSELGFAEMSAGSVLLYTGKLIHGGGANTTDATRVGFYVGYIPCWLRPLENFAKTITSEQLEQLDQDLLQRLCCDPSGYVAVFE